MTILQDPSRFENLGIPDDFLKVLRYIAAEGSASSLEISAHLKERRERSSSTLALLAVLSHLELVQESQSKISLTEEGSKFIDNANSREGLREILLSSMSRTSKQVKLDQTPVSLDEETGTFRLSLHSLPLSSRPFAVLLTEFDLLERNGDSFVIKDRRLLKFITGESARKRVSEQELMKRLENQHTLGRKAEEAVLEYEKERLPSKSADIEHVALFDVGAGYDIASFSTSDSNNFDRFIEVKAVGVEGTFYLSKNELEVAKSLRDKYVLALVKVREPESPILFFPNLWQRIESSDWILTPVSYQVSANADLLSDEKHTPSP